MENGSNSDLKPRPVSPINGQPIPNGRPKGQPNKTTRIARAAIAEFVDGNADRLSYWLDCIAEKDPEAAFRAFMSVVEYHIPKLGRTIVSGDPDAPLEKNVTIRYIDPERVQIPEGTETL